MNLPAFSYLFLFLIFIISCFSYAFDPYGVIERVIPRQHVPRLLNTLDVETLHSNNPQPLLSPEGDFNQDKKGDLALTGKYELPPGSKPYFLLVATPQKNTYQKLYFEEFDKPPLLHKGGTTGEGDPKNQAFSLSFCTQCDEGWDYYWDRNKQTFVRKSWGVKRMATPSFQKEGPVVSTATVDTALRLVGGLKDVQDYVKELKKRGGELRTTVEFENPSYQEQYWVRIFERKGKKEIEYDRLLVNIKSLQILKRKKKLRP